MKLQIKINLVYAKIVLMVIAFALFVAIAITLSGPPAPIPYCPPDPTECGE